MAQQLCCEWAAERGATCRRPVLLGAGHLCEAPGAALSWTTVQAHLALQSGTLAPWRRGGRRTGGAGNNKTDQVTLATLIGATLPGCGTPVGGGGGGVGGRVAHGGGRVRSESTAAKDSRDSGSRAAEGGGEGAWAGKDELVNE